MTDAPGPAATSERGVAAPEAVDARAPEGSSTPQNGGFAGTPSAGTNGFLFCDLRGYTAFVERHGDQAAAELLARYRTLVRAVIADHAGAEIKTEGDSVYVVFPAASAAVEAGLAIVAAAGSGASAGAPIRVGVGIHAGETVATTEGLVGGAVNIAARVCAKARAGEVVVTDTVRALTRTFLPYRYTSLGTQTLKGIAGGIPLYRVEAVAASSRARLARQLGARRGRLALVAGLVVVALVAATGVYAVNRPADCLSLPTSTHDVVARIDPGRNCVEATYPVGQRPEAIVSAGGAVWVANLDDQTVSIIDPATGLVRVTGANGTPDALAVGPTSVWVLDGSLGIMSEISLSARHPVTRRTLPVPDFITQQGLAAGGCGCTKGAGYADLTFVGRTVWVTNRVSGQILPVTADAGQVSGNNPVSAFGAIQVGKAPLVVSGGGGPLTPATIEMSGTGQIATSSGTVWVASDLGPELWRIDPGSTAAQLVDGPDHGSTVALVTGFDSVWATHPDGYVLRTSATTYLPTAIKVGHGASGIAIADNAVWVANTDDGTISRIDPATNEVVATIAVGSNPVGVVVADGRPFVSLRGP